MTQKEALAILKMGHNVYITGPAGSGKTHLLNQYIKYLKENKVDVGITASTGLAATHMNGVTIHSWSGLGIRDELTEFDLEELEERSYLWKRFESVKVLIIDEVSMLHHFRLDLIERILRHFKRNELPFGGIQVILCGDFFQLPPISRFGEPEARFIYESETWEKLDLRICYLEEQHRQTDNNFLQVLNAIRAKKVTKEVLEHLQDRYCKDPVCTIAPTRLYTHNIDVDMINNAELDKIDGEIVHYEMSGTGPDKLIELIKKSCLAPEHLRLRAGARVMFVKNNYEAGFVNGTLGIVIDCPTSGPIVRLTNGNIIKVEPAVWLIEDNNKIKAEIKQFPLRLAWAITIHKSQGMSLDAVEVDLSKSFEKGMGYVALSRVRTLAGLKLLGMNKIALEIDEDVLAFDADLKKISAAQAAELRKTSDAAIKSEQDNFLAKIIPSRKPPKKTALEEVEELLRQKKSLKEIAEKRGVKVESVFEHLEKIVALNGSGNLHHLKKEVSSVKFKKIMSAFKDMYSENRDYKLSPVKNKLGAGISFNEIRLVRLFVLPNKDTF